MSDTFNNGACSQCKKIKCEYLIHVRYTDDTEPYYMLECVDPKTGYWFERCPKGLDETERS